MDADRECYQTNTQVYTPQKLTEKQRNTGQSLYKIFSTCNGVSFAFLSDSIVILYALKIGIATWVVASTSSFIFLTLPFMLLGRHLAGRHGTARTIFHAWVSRNCFALGLIPVPWLAHNISIEAATVVLMISAFGFWSSRSVGMVVLYPIIGEITTKEDRGRFNSMNFTCFCTSYLLTTLLVIWLFHATDAPLWVFQAMICAGFVVGIMAAVNAGKIPETDAARRMATYPLKMHATMIVKSPVIRRITFAWIACSSAGALIGPFSMLALKKGYHTPDSQAMLYAVTLAFGSLLGSLAVGRSSGRTEPRNLIVIFFCGFFIPVILWIAAPPSLAPLYCLLIFAVIGICGTGAELALTHYFLNAAPENHRLGLSMMVLSTVGLLAGLSGSVLGAGILKALSGTADPLLLYKHYFIAILVILSIGFLAIARLEKLNITHAGKYIGIFLTTLTFGFLFPRRPDDESTDND
ncbi:MAG: MFS transporter [Victivallales bacterium]